MGLIYRAVSPSGKSYIGMTVRSLAKRKSEHKKDAPKGRNIFHKAIQKYGFENFTWEVLFQTDDYVLLGLNEEKFISQFGTLDRALGYNQKSGGQIGWTHSSEVRAKMAAAKLGKPGISRPSKNQYSVKVMDGPSVVGIYPSLLECSKALNLFQGNISKSMKIGRPYKGLTFERLPNTNQGLIV